MKSKTKWIGISYELYKKCIWITSKKCVNKFTHYVDSVGILCKKRNFVLILFEKCKNLMLISFEIVFIYTWKQNDTYLKWSDRNIKWMGIAYELYKKCIRIDTKKCVNKFTYFYYQPNYNTTEVYVLSCSTDFGFSRRDLFLEVNFSIFNLNMSLVCKQSTALKN